MIIKVYVPDSKNESDNDIGRRIVEAIGNNAGQLILSHDIEPDELQCGYIIRPSSRLAENVKAIGKCDAILLPDGWMCSPLQFDAWLAYDMKKILLFEKPSSANLSFLKAHKLQLVIQEATCDLLVNNRVGDNEPLYLKKTGVTPLEQMAKTRKTEFVIARVLYCHYAHSIYGIHFMDIADILHVDRTTINHYLKLYNNLVQFNQEFRKVDAKIKEFACAENSAD